MGKTIVGYIVMRTADGTFRHRDFRWRPEKAKAQVFKSEKSARMAVAKQVDTDEYAAWKRTKNASSGYQNWRYYYYSGKKYNYDNTGQEFIPVYADD